MMPARSGAINNDGHRKQIWDLSRGACCSRVGAFCWVAVASTRGAWEIHTRGQRCRRPQDLMVLAVNAVHQNEGVYGGPIGGRSGRWGAPCWTRVACFLVTWHSGSRASTGDLHLRDAADAGWFSCANTEAGEYLAMCDPDEEHGAGKGSESAGFSSAVAEVFHASRKRQKANRDPHHFAGQGGKGGGVCCWETTT